MNSLRLIGLMSGTSLDGIDLADVVFTKNEKWSFERIRTKSYPFPSDLKLALSTAEKLPAPKLFELSAKLGVFYGKLVNAYLVENKINKNDIDAVASHGQTIFHQPEKGYTVQIGNGPEGAVHSGLTWIGDFRTKNVALGGSGAPLVPIGDFELFSDQADTFLNLGGFSNLSYKKDGKIIAYDVSPANIVLNKLANKIANIEYDKGGNLGNQGVINQNLLKELNALDFYAKPHPKSLGTEWLEKAFYPILDNYSENHDTLRTIYEHIGQQIGQNLTTIQSQKVLVTGGGAHNKLLLDCISKHFNGTLKVPNREIIDFKEAIIFAFLGALRLIGEDNIYTEYTGARKNTSGGVIHLP